MADNDAGEINETAEAYDKLGASIERLAKMTTPLGQLAKTVLQLSTVAGKAAPMLGTAARQYQNASGKPLPTVSVPSGAASALPSVWTTPTQGKTVVPYGPSVAPPPARGGKPFTSVDASASKGIAPPAELTKAAGGIQGVAGATGGLAAVAEKALEMFKKLATGIVVGMQAAQAAFNKVSGSLVETVGAFNPAVVTRFQYALRDLFAVVGQMLQPALEKMTEVVQEISKWLYNLDPGTKKLISTIASAGAALAALGAAFVAIAPVITTATGGIVALGTALSVVFGPQIGIPLAIIAGLAVGFGLLGTSATDAKGPLETLRGIFNSLQDAIMPVVDAIQKSIMPAIAKMMNAFNAAGTMLGDRIATAVKAMQPALESVGQSISTLVEQFAKLLPSIIELGSAMLDLFVSAVTPSIVLTIGLAANSLSMFVEYLKPAIAWVQLMVESMTAWYKAIMDVARALRLLPKVGESGAAKKTGRDKDPAGLAARPAAFTSIEDFGQQAQLAAYSIGAGQSEKELLKEGNDERKAANQATQDLLKQIAVNTGSTEKNTQNKDAFGSRDAVKGK